MPTVQILVGGVDVTADVVFATAEFTSFVNGKPGEAYMRVRDLTSTRSFVDGSDWLVKVDGDAVWRGFVTSILRVYIAPALNVAEQGLQRFIDLRGADLNILFSRRVVFKTSDPTVVEGTQFAAATADTTAITELLTNWLDLSSDDLDTTSGVTHVGDLDPAQKTRAWSGGWYWGNAMDTIAMLPAAIYYLRPEAGSPKGTLCYVDVDVPTAPFGLSDVPDGVTTKGYRDMEIAKDGTSLANDVYAWGMGYGSQDPVFKHEVAATSQSDHGLWQSSVIAPGVYKQATINRIADSIVNGSPSSKRGAKNDRPYIRLVTYEPGLLAGHVVDFTSEVWGFTDAIPVRQLRLLFETPTDPRYELVLSHEIDAPWSFIDQFWPKLGLPHRRRGDGQTTTTTVPCDDNCGLEDGFHRITYGTGCSDTFTRLVASGLGTSEFSGAPSWGAMAISSGSATVNGTEAVLVAQREAGVVYSGYAVSSPATGDILEYLVTFLLNGDDVTNGWAARLYFGVGEWDPTTPQAGASLAFSWSSTNRLGAKIDVTDTSSGTVSSSTWLPFSTVDMRNTMLKARIRLDASDPINTVTYAKVWAVGVAEPTAWQGSRTATSVSGSIPMSTFASINLIVNDNPTSTNQASMTVSEVAITSGCTLAPTGGWSTADSGNQWTVYGDYIYAGNPDGQRVDAAGYVTFGAGTLTAPQDTGGTIGGQAYAVASASGFSASPTDIEFHYKVNCDDLELVYTGGLHDASGAFGAILVSDGDPGNAYQGFTNYIRFWLYSSDGDIAWATEVDRSGTVEGGGGLQYLDPDTGDPVPATEDVYYEVRWRFVPATTGYVTFEFKVWNPSTMNEPTAWYAPGATFGTVIADVTITAVEARLAARASTVANVTRHSTFLFFDAFVACADVGAAYDTFARPDAANWGDATSGQAWDDLSAGGTYTAEIDGNQGKLTIPSGQSTSIWEELPFGFATGDAFDVTFQVEFLSGDWSGNGSAYWGVQLYGSTAQSALVLEDIGLSPNPQLRVFSDGAGSVSDSNFPVPVGLTNVHWVQTATEQMVRLWPDGSSEPSTWDLTQSVAGHNGSSFTTFVCELQGDSAWSTAFITAIQNLYVVRPPDDCIDGIKTVTTLGTDFGGFGCEIATRVTATTYTTSVPFVPNGTLVWRDGMFMRRGGDYTEGSDHRTLTFDYAVPATSQVRVCYVAEALPAS